MRKLKLIDILILVVLFKNIVHIEEQTTKKGKVKIIRQDLKASKKTATPLKIIKVFNSVIHE